MQTVATATAIASLNISGLRIRDLSNIPQVINPRDCPLMVPDLNFITNFQPTPDNLDATNGFWESTRELNYWVFFTQAGLGRSLFESLPGMVSLFDSIASTILSTNINGVDIVGFTLNGFGTIKDTDNKEYYGFGIKVHIAELINN